VGLKEKNKILKLIQEDYVYCELDLLGIDNKFIHKLGNLNLHSKRRFYNRIFPLRFELQQLESPNEKRENHDWSKSF